MKNEGLTDITDNTGSKILSNYNIKTLMLWACEMKGRSWWTDDMNVVGICVKLLHILADCLTNAYCPHYFIINCNLFDSPDHSQLTENTAHRLQSVTEAWLAEWFVNNYVCKCARDLCIIEIYSQWFDDVSRPTHVKLQNAVSGLVDIRLRQTQSIAWFYFTGAQGIITRQYLHHFGLRQCLYLSREWAKIDEGLSVNHTAVAFFMLPSKPTEIH